MVRGSARERKLQDEPIGAGNGVTFQGDDGAVYKLYGWEATGDIVLKDNYAVRRRAGRGSPGSRRRTSRHHR